MEQKTLNNELLTHRSQVEIGSAPKTMTSAFAAGARAVLELLSDPFTCMLCAEKIAEISRQLDELVEMKIVTPRNEARNDPKK